MSGWGGRTVGAERKGGQVRWVREKIQEMCKEDCIQNKVKRKSKQ